MSGIPTLHAAISPLTDEHRHDPYPYFNQLRETAPVWRNEIDAYVYTRHADCSAILRDPRWGHGDLAERFAIRPDGVRADRMFLRLDPPDHTRLRKLVAKAFTPRMIERLKPRIEALADRLVTEALAKSDADGRVDLISAYAYPLPVTVICDLLGVPQEDRGRFTDWSHALARGLDPDWLLPSDELAERDAAVAEFRAYFTELADRRRHEPGDDLISSLVAVEEAGDRLTLDELLDTCVLLLVAGHETTVNLIANGTLALLRNPDQLALLRAGALDGDAWVDELLRYDPPVQMTARVALEEVTLGELVHEPGRIVVLYIGAANRDEQVFGDPDRLDLTRASVRHLSFGAGIHFCLGAPLARLEGQIALSTLVKRAPALRLAGEELHYRPNMILRSLAELPLILE